MRVFSQPHLFSGVAGSRQSMKNREVAVVIRYRKTRKTKREASKADITVLPWGVDRDLEGWLEPNGTGEFEPEENHFVQAPMGPDFKKRL